MKIYHHKHKIQYKHGLRIIRSMFVSKKMKKQADNLKIMGKSVVFSKNKK